MSDPYEGLPRPERDYNAFLAQGSFMLQRSRETGKFFFHPRVAEPLTGSTDLEWVQASGRGTVYSTTVIRQKPPAADYNVALIDLAEGPRMMSRVEGLPPAEVKIGMPVAARIIDENGRALLVFTPV